MFGRWNCSKNFLGDGVRLHAGPNCPIWYLFQANIKRSAIILEGDEILLERIICGG
jgi:hypothetical protein